MAASAQPAPRYHDLDALRAVATLLGIALHAAFFVLPELIYPWPVHDKPVGNDPTYDTFLMPREQDETIQLQNLLIAIACAAEFKRRADLVGLTVMEYARRIRVRRELDNV